MVESSRIDANHVRLKFSESSSSLRMLTFCPEWALLFVPDPSKFVTFQQPTISSCMSTYNVLLSMCFLVVWLDSRLVFWIRYQFFLHFFLCSTILAPNLVLVQNSSSPVLFVSCSLAQTDQSLGCTIDGRGRIH